MTRAETIAAIRSALKAREDRGRTHWHASDTDPGCVVHPQHRDCTIAWLLQEIDYQSARALVAEQFKVLGLLGKSSYQEVAEQDLRVKLAEAQVEIERLRAEMARVDTHHVAQYLASRS